MLCRIIIVCFHITRYHNYPRYWCTVLFLSFQTDRSRQTVQTQIRSSLIRVCTVCYFVYIFWTHFSTVKPRCSNFRMITTIFSVSEFLGFLLYSAYTQQLPIFSSSHLNCLIWNNSNQQAQQTKTWLQRLYYCFCIEITASRQRTAKAQIRQCRCFDWCRPLLFIFCMNRFCHVAAHCLGLPSLKTVDCLLRNFICEFHYHEREPNAQSFHQVSQDMIKPTKWHMRPAKTQISLGICPVWSESSLCAQLVAKEPSFLHADSEDSDQTGRMIWVFAGCTLILLVLSCPGSNKLYEAPDNQ